MLAASALLLCGAAAQAQLIELASPQDKSGGRFGWSAAGIADLTGDGHGDFVVGAINDQVAGMTVGRAYLFDGVTRQVALTLDYPSAIETGSFGSSVAAVPDVDGDSLPDIIVAGALVSKDPDVYRAALFSGANGSLLRTFGAPNAGGNVTFGSAVAGIADLSGDSRGEIVIGASGELSNTGRAYVFNGATGGLLRTLNNPALPGSMGRFGGAIAAVPDTNGDATPDILVGAQDEIVGAISPGRAYLFSGADGSLLRTLSSANGQSGGQFGFAVAGMADVNGDARGDLLIGADGENPGGGANRGRVYIFSGSTGGLLRTLIAPNNFEDFGCAVAPIPNFTGNGETVYIIGAKWRSYLFASSTGALIDTLANPALPLGGTESFGQSVAAIPDIDGDGRGDAILGAPLNGMQLDGDQTQAGRAYLLLTDGPPLPTATPSLTPTISPSPTPSLTASLTVSPTGSPSPTIPPPYFILHPKRQIANKGQDIAFYAEAVGVPTLQYSWTRFGAPLGPAAPALFLSNVHSEAEGPYACKVVNPGGEAISETATLTVFSTAQPNGAAFNGSTLPAVLAPNQELYVGVTMSNTSALTWSPAQGYALAVTDDAGGLFKGATRIGFVASSDVAEANGGFYQFVASIRAPSAPGSYTARVRMVEESVEFFGAEGTLSFQVSVPANDAESWERYD